MAERRSITQEKMTTNSTPQRKRGRRRRLSPAAPAAKAATLLALLLHRPDAFAEGFVIPTSPISTTALGMTAVAEAPVALQKHLHFHYHNSDTALGMAAVAAEAPVALQKHPHFHCHNSDMRYMPLSSKASSAWESIVPKADLVGTLFGGFGGAASNGGRQMRRGIIGADVTAIFDEPVDGARQLLDGCGIKTQDDNDETLHHLKEALSYYQDYVSFASGARSCKARIVASRGPVGTKCPRFHLDHVPVRLIMSLVGPGCDYIPEHKGDSSNVDRSALNTLDLDDSIRANRIIVPDEKFVVHSNVGEAIVLMGREWDTVDEAGNDDTDILHAAAHKSPSLSPFEGRVLLTVDLSEDC